MHAVIGPKKRCADAGDQHGGMPVPHAGIILFIKDFEIGRDLAVLPVMVTNECALPACCLDVLERLGFVLAAQGEKVFMRISDGNTITDTITTQALRRTELHI